MEHDVSIVKEVGGKVFKLLLIITLAFTLLVISAVDALAVYGAAYLARAETNDYFTSFSVLTKGWTIVFVMECYLIIFNLHSWVLEILVCIGVLGWVVSELIKLLTISGTNNKVIFIIMSIVLNIILFAILCVNSN